MTNSTYRSAVILCGGKGRRLGSLSKKIPKSLDEVNPEIIPEGIFLNSSCMLATH